MTVVVDEGIIVVVEVMVHPLAIALSVAALVIGFVIALMLVEVVLGDSLLSSVVAAVVAGETVFLDQIGLVIVTWMIVMMVAVMGTVTLLTAETGMVGAVIVMPMIDTRLVVIALVQTGMEVRIVISQVVMVGSEKEAMREMERVAMASMIGVAQGPVDMTGMAQGLAMTGMVHVVAVLTTMAVEDLLVMMEEVTGRDLGRMTAPAEEDAMMIASNELSAESSYVFAV